MSISKTDATATDLTEGGAIPAPVRRKRPTVGGFGYQLDAPQRPGYTRRWVNGDALRMIRMEELGYTPASEKAAEDNKRTASLGTRITRHVGKDNEGAPYQAVLMETPDHLYEQGRSELEQSRQKFEEAIRRGAKTEDTPEGAYIPSRSQINHSG